ncbi:flagellar basal body-associated FliL family protein [Eilatimonas milleporae]|uniref:Flagellar protein FliL n=1 Tax=Eilatimonas milleporae TaxID=911205 RepID=A0A3M0CQ83_9PROT|nr:flagellar basal body-associated FliL family protein [Eilatimonas milleporae]RMB08946.1 flagellar FliL protein [Eilatimonas milleporae]
MTDTEAPVLDEADLVEGLERKRLGGKQIAMIGGAVFVVLLGIVGLISLFSGGSEEEVPEDASGSVEQELERLADEAAQRRAQLEEDVPLEELQLLFYPLPDQLYNLNTGGQGASFLKARITLEVDRQSYLADLETKLPRILDEFNAYMRELRPEDLDGAAGIFRLKEELLMRINQAVAPTRVKDILFQEFLIQGG